LTAEVYNLLIAPGIQRDGTLFDAPCYVDGSWVRFQRGRPRKIGGYKGIFLNAPGITRGMIMQSQIGENYVYGGYSDSLQYWQTDIDDGVGSGPYSVTLSNFTANANNLWQFDISYDSGGSGALTLIAHPGQNLEHIDSTVNTPVLYGSFPGGSMSKVGIFTATGTASGTTISIPTQNYLIGVGQTVTGSGIPANTKVTFVTVVTSPSPLTTVTISNSVSGSPTSFTFDNNIAVSGGCVMLYPYLFVYGDNGLLQNNSAGDLTNWVGADSNANNVSATKVIKGLPVRGGTTAPAGLFWSLDSLIRVVYNPTAVGTSTIYWTYDTITSQSSIMSSQCVIEYDGIYFWCGVDRFLAYNGVVQEIFNEMNMNYFFDNINYVQRQKVWATKIPRWGEIWWFYPKGDAVECNDAVIYNVRDKKWYDAGQSLGANRSSGVFSEVFKYPVWASNEVNVFGENTIWQHETGVDEVYLSNVNAIESYFETNSLGWVNGGPGSGPIIKGLNRWIRVDRVEPDFVQSGPMSITVTGKSYADDADDISEPYVFNPDTLKIDMREQRREMRLRFTSNVSGGNYEMGNILISADIGDERGTGNP
jgi:hypothetical protein